MIQQKSFAKLAIISGIGLLLSGIYNFVFLLLPAYDLANETLYKGDEAAKQTALSKLNEIQMQADILRTVQFILLVVLVLSLAFIVVGIFKGHAKRIQK